MQRWLLIILMIFPMVRSFAQLAEPSPAKVSQGQLWRIPDFPSQYVQKRNIDIWLPPGYDPETRYPVLYMHDGQMLFDSTTTWNKQEWQVDEVAGTLIGKGELPSFIIVGVWNVPQIRHTDYFPQKPFELLTPDQQDSLYQANRTTGASVFGKQKVHSDDYLRFLVRELKPYIDRNYPTKPGRSHTYIAGSSMGGLISLYAICEYPEVFGGAACLSTHWPGIFSMENNPIPATFFYYLSTRLPDPHTHRLYFDYGDQTLDALYPPLQQEADRILFEKGFTPGKNWVTQFFPGEDHSEKAWAKRLNQPLKFLLQQ